MKTELKKDKNKKMVIQTGIFTVLFLSILALILSTIIIYNSYSLQKQSILDYMTSNLKKTEESINTSCPSFLRNYIEQNPDCIKDIKKYKVTFSDDNDKNEYDELFLRLFNGNLSEDYFNSLDTEKKNTLCAYSYITIFTDLMMSYNKNQLEDILIISAPVDDHASIFSHIKKYEDDNMDDYTTKAEFGTEIVYSSDEHPAYKELLDNPEKKYAIEKITVDGTAVTNIVAPLQDDSNTKYIISLTFMTEDLDTLDIRSAIIHVVLVILLGTIIASLLVSFAIYFIIIRPLSKVSNSINDYTDHKDSSIVDKEMSLIHSKNEIGILADDFRDLTSEIERYTNENITMVHEQEKISADLNTAATIQNDMLIKEFPTDSRFSIFASMTPAKEVGGDFYDFFMIDEDHLGLTIADVSGKGVPASLVMMSTLTSIRHYASVLKTPNEILRSINNELSARNIMNMFVTVWFGILDLNSGLLTTANAGHEYPAVNINGRFELFKDKHGFVIGGMPGMKYKNEEIQLKSGDSIFVYTDGVPEATDPEEKLYGTDKMIEALNISPNAQPKELLENVKASVDNFVKDAPQFDDLTMLSIKYYG